MPNLHGLLEGWLGWEVALSLVVVAVVAVVGWRNGFELAFSGALLGSFLVSHHAYLHDCAVLIPGLVEIVTRMRRQPARPAVLPWAATVAWGLAVTLLTPFPYFLPPLFIHIREGLVPVLLILALLALLTRGENKA
jgi:hypothetical protein